MADLDEAIVLARERLDLCPPGHPDRSVHLGNLGACLGTRNEHIGAIEDLDEATALDREALELCQPGHPERSRFLNSLAVHLSSRYRQLGEVEDLDEAIVLSREAFDLRPAGNPERSTSLNNLAIDLFARYKRLGGSEDLDEAIVLCREALVLRPSGHPFRSSSLMGLGVYLSYRFKLLGAMEDLNAAIALDQEALDICPPGNPHLSYSLNSLACHFSARYDQLGKLEDLNKAIAFHREALALRPKGHPGRSTSLHNLADDLSIRHQQLGAAQDLEDAIVLVREALDARPQGYPGRSGTLNNLAGYLRVRFTQSRQIEDKEELFTLYAQLVDVPAMVSSIDLSAARAWIHVAEEFQHPTTILAYETSLRLLTQHLAALPSLPQHLNILKNLSSSLAVDACSACLRNHAPALAVELLEQGRGIFWSQLTRLRSPLDEIIASGPTGKILADEFRRLTSLIRNALDSSGADQHERVCHLNLDMQKVVTNIRELPGLSRFLLPSVFSDLQRAASGGPVIIVNASQYSCDALVVLYDRDPIHIPLSITREYVRHLSSTLLTMTTRAKLINATRDLGIILRELWDDVVSPIIDFLRTIHPLKSRIWWCPTAEFSLLPLHAAGPYRKGQQNLASLYISSYAPTLTTLIRARRYGPSSSLANEKRFVAIGQANATGQSQLLSVDTELTNIGHHVDSFATFTRIEGLESCISRIAEELGKNEWVHLARHGLPNRKKPFESAFALYDGHFRIEHIIRCDLKNPEFAYLSACHTTVGDEVSPDEVIHLASAMQFAGFRSVIGTMGAVDDSETNKVTSTFYRHMVDESGRLDHTRAAYALNKTMKSVKVPLDQQILYMHLGA